MSLFQKIIVNYFLMEKKEKERIILPDPLNFPGLKVISGNRCCKALIILPA